MNNDKQPAKLSARPSGLPPAKFPVAILRNYPASTNLNPAPVIFRLPVHQSIPGYKRRIIQHELQPTQHQNVVDQARQPSQQQRIVPQGHQLTQLQHIVQQAPQPTHYKCTSQQRHQVTQNQYFVEQAHQPTLQKRIVQQGHQLTQYQRTLQQGHQRHLQQAYPYGRIHPKTALGVQRKHKLIQKAQPAEPRALRLPDFTHRSPSSSKTVNASGNVGHTRMGTFLRHQSQDTSSITQYQPQVVKVPIQMSLQHVNHLERQQRIDETQDVLLSSDDESQDDEGVEEGPMTFQQFVDNEFYHAQMPLRLELSMIDEDLD